MFVRVESIKCSVCGDVHHDEDIFWVEGRAYCIHCPLPFGKMYSWKIKPEPVVKRRLLPSLLTFLS